MLNLKPPKSYRARDYGFYSWERDNNQIALVLILQACAIRQRFAISGSLLDILQTFSPSFVSDSRN